MAYTDPFQFEREPPRFVPPGTRRAPAPAETPAGSAPVDAADAAGIDALPAPGPERRVVRLCLVTGGHVWRFGFSSGCERPMIGTISAMARDPACPLDWPTARRLVRLVLETCGSADTRT
ncbi:MAG: hypothetical protein KF817_15765 [Phycisphaeraceae bacterium]|nr:hypothetical protein [Phycisphaeraceae bacterium]